MEWEHGAPSRKGCEVKTKTKAKGTVSAGGDVTTVFTMYPQLPLPFFFFGHSHE